MNLTIKTPLDQIRDALESIEDARGDAFISRTDRNNLEAAAVNLRNLERYIIETKQNELINALAADSLELKHLVGEMNASVEHLANVSAIVEKASNAVEAFITILITAARVGLL
ncbi:MAG: hypothetical protein ABI151_12415 [Chitinophagaceae bacterium]